MRTLTLIAALFLFSGCATHDGLIERFESPKKGGTVEYFWLSESKRPRALDWAKERAREHCAGGDFEITKTGIRTEGFNTYETISFFCK